MSARMLGIVLSALFAVAGCSSPDSSPRGSAQATGEVAATHAAASFVNRVWVVAESQQVATGELRVLLSEGTLVMASPHGTPSLGTWRYRDGHLTITEEGLPYDVEILELSENTFRIRIHSPGDPVDIRFEPAGQPAIARDSADQPEGR